MSIKDLDIGTRILMISYYYKRKTGRNLPKLKLNSNKFNQFMKYVIENQLMLTGDFKVLPDYNLTTKVFRIKFLFYGIDIIERLPQGYIEDLERW